MRVVHAPDAVVVNLSCREEGASCDSFQDQSSHEKLKQSHEEEEEERRRRRKKNKVKKKKNNNNKNKTLKRPSTVVLVRTCRSSENCISKLVISPTRSKMERTVLDVEGPSQVDLLAKKWEGNVTDDKKNNPFPYHLPHYYLVSPNLDSEWRYTTMGLPALRFLLPYLIL